MHMTFSVVVFFSLRHRPDIAEKTCQSLELLVRVDSVQQDMRSGVSDKVSKACFRRVSRLRPSNES